ncbi:MFS transporter [Rhodohalobacter sulfatireducens]|uniref:MFS transporter n=1 Tax=Rhodohalobacter sulfatireducens TaxID=2911366 RepID=A0ABS9KJC6_9BACT|nr:MFS transporter [Rhodohalobacter sulfatireducens]MCG2590953.1 MFS transporter [Rhodohalobacter sulfatireducens]
MNSKNLFAHPVTFFFLVVPSGISTGFITVTLPYILTQNGFSVGEAATITAVALSSNLWRFLWAPIVDLTLSLHKWYLIGVSLTALSLFSIYLIPFDTEFKLLLTFVVFISQVAASFANAPVGGFMAKTVREEQKGRAAGWYQAGNLGGTGFGGGAGIWLASHFSSNISLLVLSVSMLFCAFTLSYLPQVVAQKTELKKRFTLIFVDLKALFRNKLAIYSIALFITPVGVGAASGLWSSVAFNWEVNADNIALIVGVFSAFASVIGCIIGGWIADRFGRWTAYFGAGCFMALISFIMYLAPNSPIVFNISVLVYAVSIGVAYAAFSAVVLHAIGKGMAATKYALLSSFGNISPVYMTALNGWVYDGYGIKTMLLAETVLGIAFVIIFIGILKNVDLRSPVSSPQVSIVNK